VFDEFDPAGTVPPVFAEFEEPGTPTEPTDTFPEFELAGADSVFDDPDEAGAASSA
jgi:hypothetical protein